MPTQCQIYNRNAWVEWRLRVEPNHQNLTEDRRTKRLHSRFYRMKDHVKQQQVRDAKNANRSIHRAAQQAQYLRAYQAAQRLQQRQEQVAVTSAVNAATADLNEETVELRQENRQLQTQVDQAPPAPNHAAPNPRDDDEEDEDSVDRGSTAYIMQVRKPENEAGDPIYEKNADPQQMMAARKLSAFRRQPALVAAPDEEGEWDTAPDPLGAGSCGVAYLYLKHDWEGNLIDRVVVKDCWLPHRTWTCPWRWHGDTTDPDKLVPMEARCMQVIKGQPGSEFCVEIRGRPAVNVDELWYRIYMEFCPYGSLQDLIAPGRDGSEVCHSHLNIPEEALWHIFQNLVDACLVLQYGAVEREDAVDDWRPIVHRDIKPDNVWLDEPAEEFPSYPRARLGDFGIAIMTDENDPYNPLAYNDGMRAKFWRAPEQHLYLSPETLTPLKGDKLGEKTNVWQLGAVMVRLMSRTSDPENQTPGRGDYRDPRTRKLRVGALGKIEYSDDLINLVQDCTQPDPQERPSLRQLRDDIFWYTGSSDAGDHTDDLRSRKLKRKEKPRLQLRYPQEEERYKLYMANANEDGDSGEESSDDEEEEESGRAHRSEDGSGENDSEEESGDDENGGDADEDDIDNEGTDDEID